MKGRRVRVDRKQAQESEFSKAQLLELRSLFAGELKELTNHAKVLDAVIAEQRTYVYNLSVILNDIRSSVNIAKFSSGSTKVVLAELIQGLETSLENVEHLPSVGCPPPSIGVSPGSISCPSASESRQIDFSSNTANYALYQGVVSNAEEEHSNEDDPVENFSDMDL